MNTDIWKSSLVVGVVLIAGSPCMAASPDVLDPVPEQDVLKIQAALPNQATAKPKSKRKLLVMWLCGGFFHRSIPWCNEAIERMGEKTGAWETVITNDLAAFNAENLQQFDAVFLNNTCYLEKDMTAQQRQALLDFVNGGKGLIGCHGAGDNFKRWPEGAAMLGGTFNGHPWGSGSTVKIVVEDPDNPINQAFQGKDFTIKDEIYQFRDHYSRDRLRVLLALDMYDGQTVKGGRHMKRPDWDYAVSWIREQGKGRIFYCSLGHNNEIFWNPAILQHYLDGIQFALGDLPNVDCTPSSQLYGVADVDRALSELLHATSGPESAAAERTIGILLSRIVDKNQVTVPLQKAIEESSGATREALLRLCARSSSEQALQTVIGKLASDQDSCRQAAIAALAESADLRAAEALIDAARDARSDSECALALDRLSHMIMLPAAAELPELLEDALPVARTEEDKVAVLALFVKAESTPALKRAVGLLDNEAYRSAAIDAILNLAGTWKLKNFASDAVVAACEKVIAVAPDDRIKATAQQRIDAAMEAKERRKK